MNLNNYKHNDALIRMNQEELEWIDWLKQEVEDLERIITPTSIPSLEKYRLVMLDEIARLEHEQETIKQTIQELIELDEKLGKLVAIRIIGNRSWAEVADLMGYDIRWVYRLRQQANKLLAERDLGQV